MYHHVCWDLSFADSYGVGAHRAVPQVDYAVISNTGNSSSSLHVYHQFVSIIWFCVNVVKTQVFCLCSITMMM